MHVEPAATKKDEIRTIRKRKGWKVRELAARAGISPSYLTNIERGDRQGAPATILAIANALGVPIEQITTG